MSSEIRWEQCCVSDGCTRPRRFDDLCAACFHAATAAQRATALLLDKLNGPDLNRILERMCADLQAFDAGQQPTEPIDSVGLAEVVMLEAWLERPAFGEEQAA